MSPCRLLLRWFCCFLLAAMSLHAQSPNFDVLRQRAATEREAGQLQEALRDYRQSVELKPDWAEGWWYQGTLLYDANRFEEAKPNFQKVVELLPSMGAAWDFLGLCEFEGKDYAPALEHLQTGVRLGASDDPETARVAAYHLALLFVRVGKFEQTTSMLSEGFPDSDQVKIALGLAALRVPLLPNELDPSKEALLRDVGAAEYDLARRNLPSALRQFGDLVSSNPATPYLHYAYARALETAGRSAEALEQLKLETKLQPHSAAAHTALAQALQKAGQSEQSAKESAIAAQVGKGSEGAVAELYLAKTSSNAENNGADTWKEAMSHYAAADYDRAASLLKVWLQSHAQDGTAWAVLGLSEFETGDFDNALIHLERGHSLGFGGDADAIQLANLRLAMLLNRASRFDEARAVLTGRPLPGARAGELEFVLGMTLLRMPQFPDQVKPSLQPTVQMAGETAALLQHSKYDQALAKFEEMLRKEPELPFLHYAYGTALIALSRYEDAATQMREEVRISSRSPLPLIRLASIEIRQHRAAEAMQYAQQALALAPDSSEAHYLLGRAYLDTGDATHAVTELEAASKTLPNSPEVHYNLAKAYARTQRTEEAERERATFVRLNAMAENTRSGQSSYEGPREGSDLQSGTPTPD